MHSIFEDTTQDTTSSSLELDRFKEKIREIWGRLLESTYRDDGLMSKDEYLESNALKFDSDPQPENEVDSLLSLLDELLENKDEIHVLKSEGKAPTYKGDSLKEHNQKRKIDKTMYDDAHSSTKTPTDSRKVLKTHSQEDPTGGMMKSSFHERPDISSIKGLSDELEKEHRRLLAYVAKRNRMYGVEL